jgi:hypothetical protein
MRACNCCRRLRSKVLYAASCTQQLERGRVAPVRILKQHQHRLPRRQPLDLCHQRPQRLLLLPLRRQVERRVAFTLWDRQQHRE